MNWENEKCVIVVDQELPIGLIANTSAIMGITLGKKHPEVVGKSVIDKSGMEHLGIIEFPVPILKCKGEEIKKIREKLYDDNFSDVLCVDFTDVAQGCKSYEEFIGKISCVPLDDLKYMGVCLCGPKKKVNKLTGAMPLLR
ncbi:DUF2000 domain-containing protein [Lacrimispora sp.]|uniref:DUF2000 domain-containing protein n=1 Tax=Lacrimispora sp. TaxID=2719234 RepID=UPI0028AD2599|nr:DUF2000 domain-containing protein [Lacrimispora sp.]